VCVDGASRCAGLQVGGDVGERAVALARTAHVLLLLAALLDGSLLVLALALARLAAGSAHGRCRSRCGIGSGLQGRHEQIHMSDSSPDRNHQACQDDERTVVEAEAEAEVDVAADVAGDDPGSGNPRR